MISLEKGLTFKAIKWLSVLFTLLIFSSQSLAAIVVDPTSITVKSGNLSNGTALSTAGTFTVSGTDRLLLVGISFQNNRRHYATEVTYGSVNLTKIATHIRGNSSRVEIWGLVEADAPALTFNTAQIIAAKFATLTATGNNNQTRINRGVILGAVAVSGVNQTLPYKGITNSDGNSAAPSLPVPSSSGDMVFAVVSQEDQTPQLTANPNEKWNDIASGTTTNTVGAGATVLNSGSPIEIGWGSNGDSNNWAMVGLAIKPTLAGGATTSCVTFKDTFPFSVRLYSNDESDVGFSWKNDWDEINETDDPTLGRVRIMNTGPTTPLGELRLRGNIDAGGNRSIEREVNLTAYDYAHLKFAYRTANTNTATTGIIWTGTDELNVTVTGTSKPTLNTNILNRHDAPSTQTIDITNQISDTTKINYTSTTSADNTKYAFIDYVEVKACSGPPTIESASAACPDLTEVTINFSKAIDISTAGAGNESKYTLTKTTAPFTVINVTAASAPGGSTVTLTTDAMALGTNYTLSITGVKDTTGGTIAAGSTTTFDTHADCLSLIGYYALDGGTIATDDLPNTSTFTANDAVRVGAGTTPISAGKYCNAAYIPLNDNGADFNAIDTKFNSGGSYPALADSGSINFWYRSDVDWVTAPASANRTLFDASSGGNDRFYLILRDDGRLRFQARNGNNTTTLNVTSGVGDTESFTASDWVHISVTWDFQASGSTAAIFVNGSQSASNTDAELTGISGSLNNLYIGDNHNNAPLNGTLDASSAGGRIDELYIYNTTERNQGSTHSCPSLYCNYRDDFGSSVYSNSDGASPWSSDWVTRTSPSTTETPDGTYVSLAGGEVKLINSPTENPAKANIERGFSLFGITGDVNIFYTFTIAGNIESIDEAIVEVNNGTTTFEIDNINNLAAGTHTRKIVLTEAQIPRTATMKIIIRIDNTNAINNPPDQPFCCYEDAAESISFKYLAIYNDGICTINPLDHIEILFDGQGLNCEAETIYIKACATSDCTTTTTTVPGVTVDIETYDVSTSGPWVPRAPDFPITSSTNGNYLKSYSLSIPDPGSILIRAVDHQNETPVNTTTLCRNIDDGQYGPYITCSMEFYDSLFKFTPVSQASCGTQASSYEITAVRTDSTNTNKCETVYGDDKVITFSLTGVQPTDDIIVTGTGTTAGPTSATLKSTNPSDPVELKFVAGVAPFTIQRPNNAGQFTLQADRSDSGLDLTGSTTITFRPHEFFIQATDLSDVNLHNTTAAGDPKWKTSDNFRLRLRAQCQGNSAIATNYVPTNAEMSVELALPVGGSTKDFALQASNFPSTTTTSWTNISSKFGNGSSGAGAVTDGTNDYADAAYHEVGVLNLRVRDTDYLGGAIAENVQAIGRFIPHHFDTLVTNGCTDFTYSGQPFRVQAIARNNLAATTLNYAADFARDTTLSDTGVTTNFFKNTLLSTEFSAGTATTDDPSAQVTAVDAITYTFPAKDTIPFSLAISARDTETDTAAGVAVPGAVNGTTEIRSGRTSLESVFGPVTTALSMELSTEYYDGNGTPQTDDDGFILSNTDSCTQYEVDTANSIGSFGNYIPDPSPLAVGGLTATAGPSTVLLGIGAITITPPNNAAGKVNLLMNSYAVTDTQYPVNPSWLTYPWGIDCFTNADTGTTPAAACGTATFGLYRGDDRIIYWRELF